MQSFESIYLYDVSKSYVNELKKKMNEKDVSPLS